MVAPMGNTHTSSKQLGPLASPKNFITEEEILTSKI